MKEVCRISLGYVKSMNNNRGKQEGLRSSSKGDNTPGSTSSTSSPSQGQSLYGNFTPEIQKKLPVSVANRSKSDPRERLSQYKYTPRGEKKMAEDKDKIKPPKTPKKEIMLKNMTPEKWWKMYQDMATSLKQIQKHFVDIYGMSEEDDEWNERLKNSLNVRLNDLELYKVESEARVSLLVKTVIRQDEVIQDLMKQVVQIKREKIKKNLVISGIEEDSGEKSTDLKEKVNDFFTDKMEISQENQVNVKMVRRNGPKDWKDRSVTVAMSSMQDKMSVLKHTANLKGKLNARRRLYFVDDDMDQEQVEKKRCFRELRKENASLPQEEKMNIKFQRNNIVVDNQIIKKRVRSPTVKEVLSLYGEELARVNSVKVMPVEEQHEQGSNYYAYVQKVRNVTDVQNGLMKLQRKHMDATHVSCGYRLTNAKGPFYQEGHDDGEFGSGRTILEVLKKKKLANVCIFVIRYYGGVRLGAKRFEIVRGLSEKAIATYQYKCQERRSRIFRATSQDSIPSVISALSFDDMEGDLDRESLMGEDEEAEGSKEQRNKETNG